MLKSMTGFGRSEKSQGLHTCKVEVRSVNNRFLEVHARLPKTLSALEATIKSLVKTFCTRGSFDITVTLEKDSGGPTDQEVTPNLQLATQYVDALRQIQSKLGLSGTIDVNSVISIRDIVKIQPVQLGGGEEEIVLAALQEALQALAAMRIEEGKNLQKDLVERVEAIAELGGKIQTRQPNILEEYRARLRERIKLLTEGADPDPLRIDQETALLADRCDITEEVIRLASHIRQFTALCDTAEPQGRKLEFIAQEINRETNTIGSKSSDYQVSQWVIEIKSTSEKIREQLQNIE
jgi:uncharacterized protein (TIGR00255 family)